jgi:hypothetical protein
MLQVFYISDNKENCFAIRIDIATIEKINLQIRKSIEISNDNPEVQSIEFKSIEVYSAPGLNRILEQIQEEYSVEIDTEDYTTFANVVYPTDEDAIFDDVISDATTHIYPNGLMRISGFSDLDLRTTISDYFGIDDFGKLKIDLTISEI